MVRKNLKKLTTKQQKMLLFLFREWLDLIEKLPKLRKEFFEKLIEEKPEDKEWRVMFG